MSATKQVAWLNLKIRHGGEARQSNSKSDQRLQSIRLAQILGSGKSASADGTKWNLYEQNLITEYHIRYGGYGELATTTFQTSISRYSAGLFPAVYEALYILDVIQNSDVDIQPDTLHGDTQSQSTPVFALFFQGIQLMPHIRGIKKLTFFKADAKANPTYRSFVQWYD